MNCIQVSVQGHSSMRFSKATCYTQTGLAFFTHPMILLYTHTGEGMKMHDFDGAFTL